MFIHSGAAFHGHEYSHTSPKRSPSDPSSHNNHTSRRIPYPRSSFSNPIIRNTTIYENPLPLLSPRPSSEKTPRSFEPAVRFKEPETMSEDGRSIAYSDGSEVTASSSRRKRQTPTSRTSTAFHLALPPPTLTQKQRLLEIRPKLLLQLQRLSADSRPMPQIDVLPSTLVVPRLAKRFPRMFRGKGALGCNDVMIVKSEEYSSQNDTVEGSETEEESIANRDLLAVICQIRKASQGASGRAEIVLSDGSIWIATHSSTTSYDFVSTDKTGQQITARWVKRNSKRSSADEGTEPKFTFSIIDPNSRRHPILASITQNKLDIPDTYTSLSSSAGKYPPTSPIMSDTSSSRDDETTERATCIMDETTKRIIQITGIWLALREGWSPYFKYNDAQAIPTSRVRSVTLTPDARRPGDISTPESTNSPLCSLGNRMRRVSTDRVPKRSVSTPKRSISTGTAFMQRENARRIGNTPAVSDSEGDADKSIILTTTGGDSYRTSDVLPGSGATTPETPTRRSGRRPLSVQIPTSRLQNEVVNQPKRHSMLDMETRGPAPRAKEGRWKTITNIFRRRTRTSG